MMRVVFLIPELLGSSLRDRLVGYVAHSHRLGTFAPIRRLLVHRGLYTTATYGGTLNLMRNAALASSLGVEALLATPRGIDTYGDYKVVDLPFMRWADRRHDDVCVVPDFCTDVIDRVAGRAVAYLQSPLHVRANFDYADPRVELWTDSPFMLELCQRVYPHKEITIVPNIVDPEAFPFRPQAEREPGLIFAFPRKGPEFIAATREAYAALGGSFWHFELIDGLSLHELARAMRRPQAFLASAEVEGCALPPQESMASGIVVVGKSARGANFSMVERETAMIAETPAEAARALVELEDTALRDHISREGHRFIQRYFPEGEPRAHWQRTLEAWSDTAREPGLASAPRVAGMSR